MQAQKHVQQYQASLEAEGEEALRHLLTATATLTAALLSLSSHHSYRTCLRCGVFDLGDPLMAHINMPPWLWCIWGAAYRNARWYWVGY